ncbi:MAG: hypothetical protein DMG30_25440 [Acidobacteria bacterium]|nr:MAG: hypothetical protein DMG30_25440 [Acidobacteriota bacterium]
MPWSELTGGPRGTVEEFRDILRRYPRSSLLRACARLSVLFNYGPDADTTASDEATAKWAPLLFQAALLDRIGKLGARRRVIFFQAQLRSLASEVIRLNPFGGEDLAPVPDGMLGELMLRAGELLYQQHPKPTDELDEQANLISQFLPIYEMDSPTEAFIAFLRFYIFLTINIPRLPEELKTFDVAALFEKQFGFPLDTYAHFIFCFGMHAMIQRGKKSIEAAVDSGIRIETFRNMKLTPDTINRMFETVSFSLDTLSAQKLPTGYADFEFLRDHPYFLQNGEIFCLDYEFAMGKLESGVLWRVMKGLEQYQKEPYLSFWGNVFEDYVSWLFETYSSSSLNMIYPAPTYADDPMQQVCDAIVVCGSTAILIEAKLATVRADIRYSGDYKKMRAFLEDRLVCGTTRRVGVTQLVHALDRITSVPPLALPPWLAGVRKFIPVIVTKDDIGSSWVVNAYLNKRFRQEAKRHKKYTITPLVSLSVSTLERLMKTLKELPLAEILEGRMQEDKTLTRPFEAASKYAQSGVPGRLSVHMEILHELMERMTADFGLTDPSSPAQDIVK